MSETKGYGNSGDFPKDVNWDKTKVVARRIKDNPFYEEPDEASPNGYYKGRKIIGRDIPINGGVYLGQGPREAIVVDETHGELLNEYKAFVEQREKKVASGEAETFKKQLLGDVFAYVKKQLEFDLEKVEEIHENEGNGEADKKISLDVYLQYGAGVCRHQALFGGYLLERLAKDGRIGGKVSVDRNFIKGRGGHAWIRYTNEKGKVFIIDPAQNFIGLLDSVDDKRRWFYKRPTDE